MSDTAQIHPVILCGGSGTRLWPLSRQSYPKQFTPLIGAQSLFQASVLRTQGPDFAPPVIVTGEPFRFIVIEQLAAARMQAAGVLIEPEGRNTAPAVLAAAQWLVARDPEALMLVAPSDHVIPDAEAFQDAVRAAMPCAQAGDLVTFGIRPDRAETGYGWLELAAGAEAGAASPQPLARFVEKPDSARAKAMLEAGTFLWNAGIFLFSARAVIAAFETHAPAMLAPVQAAVDGAENDLGFTRLAAEPWADVPANSIDYAIMEHADNLAVMPFGAGWSDLGDWQAVWAETGPDQSGNVVSDHATALECTGSLLRSENAAQELVGIGLQDMVVVAMPDAVVVAPRAQSQRVKEAVAALKERGAKQATAFPVDHRPWGWFESLVIGERFQVKRIVVKPPSPFGTLDRGAGHRAGDGGQGCAPDR